MWTFYRPGKDGKHPATNELPWTLNCFTPPTKVSSLCCMIIFTGGGLISRVVISSVLVWTRDARKRTSPEVCIPSATCHFSHRGHKSSPKARMTTQSQEHDTASKLFSCLFDPVAHWTLDEQVTCSADLKKDTTKKSAFAAALLYLHLTEMSSAGCVSNSFLLLYSLLLFHSTLAANNRGH